MAIAFPTVTAEQFSVQGRRTVTDLRAQNAAQSVRRGETSLPDGVVAGRGSTVVLTRNEGIALLSTSLAAGQSILAGLQALRSSLDLAANSSLVNSSAGVTHDNTRISGVTIQAQAGRIRGLIDQLASAATIGGGNLLRSNAYAVEVQTTAYGGRLRLAGQPLDAEGLGLGGLDAVSRTDARASLAEVTRAITTARDRLGNLTAVQRALGYADASGQTFAGLLRAGSADALPRGTLVNLNA